MRIGDVCHIQHPTGLVVNLGQAQPPPEDGSAFVACRDLSVLDDILGERFERTVRKDNYVHFEGRVLQIPADRHRCHYVKAKIRVLRL